MGGEMDPGQRGARRVAELLLGAVFLLQQLRTFY